MLPYFSMCRTASSILESNSLTSLSFSCGWHRFNRVWVALTEGEIFLFNLLPRIDKVREVNDSVPYQARLHPDIIASNI
ncbi:hypothetical protein DITRI_Ditri04bG0064400 [Diplodiscus trichospermus]